MGGEIWNSAFCQVGEGAEDELTQSSPGRGAARGVNGAISHFLGEKQNKSGYWSRCFYGDRYNFILVMDYTAKLQGGLRWWSFIWQTLSLELFGSSGYVLCFIQPFITVYILFSTTTLHRGVVWDSSAQSPGKAPGVCSGPGMGRDLQQWNFPINFVFAPFWTRRQASDKIRAFCF